MKRPYRPSPASHSTPALEEPMKRTFDLRFRLRPACVLLACWGLAGSVAPAHAETSRTCTGFIDSVPTVLTTQGTWCLRRDVSTGVTSGNAIEIATNNVTIDCNGFKIGGLAGGDASLAQGIYAHNHKNITIRNCSIRGFRIGIHLAGHSGTMARSTGHLVENNHIDNSLKEGIRIYPSRGTLIRGNRILDTGGAADDGALFRPEGIYAQADVVDNVIVGVFGTSSDVNPRGIAVFGGGNRVKGNIVRDLVVSGPRRASGIYMGGDANLATGNQVHLDPAGSGVGIGASSGYNYCRDNTMVGFATPLDGCEDIGGNYAN